MRIALIGYGKMGRTVERLAVASGHEIVASLDFGETEDELVEAAPDVVIEFTSPAAAPANIAKCARLGFPVVCGTTGWLDEIESVSGLVTHARTALVYGSNFSIGVAIFRRVLQTAAAEFSKRPEYETWGHEIHHSAKVDAPSGTMLTLAEDLRRAGIDKLDIASSRAGKVPGTHTIGFDSLVDTITLTHQARSRDGFALGAIHAAEWILGKKGVYEFAETL